MVGQIIENDIGQIGGHPEHKQPVSWKYAKRT